MSIKISFNISPLEQKFGTDNIQKTRVVLANQILVDSDKYIPKLDGSLRASGHCSSGGKQVIWNTVYARAHFYGTNGIVKFRRYTTPVTGTKWTEVAERGNIDKWENIVKKGLGIR